MEHNWSALLGSAEGAMMMTIPTRLPPAHWSPLTISSDEDSARLDQALEALEEQDQWVTSFIQRLNHAVEAIGNGR